MKCSGNGIRDLSALAGAPLENLDIGNNAVTDLSPLRGCPLKTLTVNSSPIRDLEPLRGLPLEGLNIDNCTALKDFTPLLELPQLKRLSTNAKAEYLEPLRKHPAKPAIKHGEVAGGNGPHLAFADFWPAFDALLQKRKLAAEERQKSLTDLRHALAEAGTRPSQLDMYSEGVLEITINTPTFHDLRPLEGWWFKKLVLSRTQVRDLSPLHRSQIGELDLYATPVSDLSPLAGNVLHTLRIADTQVRDLSPLKGLPLKVLHFDKTPVTDVRPLGGIKTLEVMMVPEGVKDLDPLRHLPNLTHLSHRWDSKSGLPAQTATEFWKEHDAKNNKPPE